MRSLGNTNLYKREEGLRLEPGVVGMDAPGEVENLRSLVQSRRSGHKNQMTGV